MKRFLRGASRELFWRVVLGAAVIALVLAFTGVAWVLSRFLGIPSGWAAIGLLVLLVGTSVWIGSHDPLFRAERR